MTTKALKWVCPECGKVILSLYPKQLEQQKSAHLFTHDSKQPPKGAVE